MKRTNVVYSLITDPSKTKILMVNNVNSSNGDRWTLPGGAVEEDESLDEAVVREAKEETGLDIKVHGIVAVNEVVFGKQGQMLLMFTFRAEVIGGVEEIIRPDEIMDIQWIDLDEADQLMPYYLEGLSGIVRKGNEVTYYNEGKV